MTARTKAAPGHRMKPLLYLVEAHCECGWKSSTWCSARARVNALSEWRAHKLSCEPVAPGREAAGEGVR